MIRVGNFCTVKNDKYKEAGVEVGERYYVAGSTVRPLSDDSYDWREYFICAFMDGDHVDVNKQGFLADGDDLENVDELTQKRLEGIKEKDFEALEKANTNESTD